MKLNFTATKGTPLSLLEILQKKTIGGAVYYYLPITEEGDTAQYAASIKAAIRIREGHEGDKTAFLF